MNCKECTKFNTCEKAKNPENYKIDKCKDFKLKSNLFIHVMIGFHVETVEKLIDIADSSGYDRNEVLKRFSNTFNILTQITNFNNFEVKNGNEKK